MLSRQQKRRDRIAELVHERGAVTVDFLAERLGVSMQTIRRDLEVVCDVQQLQRRHGRVELTETLLNTPFDQRAGTNPEGKRAIGLRAAALIPDGATLFISIGSTPLCVAQALRGRRNLTVITNNLSVAMALSDEVSNRIILPGGEVRLPDRDMLGDEVLDMIDRYRAEFAVFGCAGVDEDGGLLEFHAAETRAAERMREQSRRSILVIDRSKFGRHAPALGGNVTDVDHVVMDRLPGAEFQPLIERIGDRLVLAEGDKR